jgi:hypothetical protein
MFALVEIWLLVSAAVGWAGIVLAVVLDARARVDNPAAARAAAVLAAALPFAGGAIWLCLRPVETRRDRRERRLERQWIDAVAPTGPDPEDVRPRADEAVLRGVARVRAAA